MELFQRFNNVIFLVVVLWLDITVSQQVEVQYRPREQDQEDVETARQLPNIESPQVGGMLALALLGSAATVMSKVAPFAAEPDEGSNRRIDYETRATAYAKNVAAFEDRMERRIKNGVASMRRGARKASRFLRNGFRETATRGFNVVRSGVNGISRVADGSMRSLARATTNGFRRLGSATTYGVGRMGNGAGSGIARVGTAARLGITRMTDAYRRSLARAGHGIFGVGSAAGNGLSRVARTYIRGISRLGNVATAATSRIGSATSGGVSRMGEIAQEGVSKVAEVATTVPQTMASVATDKKLQECILQTMCYVSSPYLNGDKTQRKRMLRSLVTLIGDNEISDTIDELDDDEDVTVLHSKEDDGVVNEEVESKLEDCDVFKCEIASLGRQAFRIVSELREAASKR